jgi:hypothetical protein
MRRKAFHEKFTNELHAAVCLCFGLVVRHIYTGGRYIYIYCGKHLITDYLLFLFI